MNSFTQVAGICLRIPGRVYDLFAIGLISTGINVVTGAGGHQSECLAFASGFSLCVAGVVASSLKGRADRVTRAVESSERAKAEEIARRLSANALPTSSPVPTTGKAAGSGPKKKRSPVAAVVEAHLLRTPREAAIVTAECMLLLALMMLGTVGIYCGLYADENTDLPMTVESTARGIHERMQTQGEHLANNLGALSSSISSNHTVAVGHATAQFRDVAAQIEGLRRDIASLSATISNGTHGAGPDAVPRDDAADE